MSEQKENHPNKETQMSTSGQDEANQENLHETPQQESNPEEEEEEEDKKTVTNPRNVVLEPDPLAPFLVRLEHDQETQIGFFKGMIDFHEQNKEYPFQREEAMEDFINNWLEVRVPRLDFQQTLDRVWRRYVETGRAIGENLNALSPVDRQVFLLANRILFAYHSEEKDKKRKNQETHGATSSNKGVEIGGSNAPPDKEPEKGLKQYKEVEKKMVDETKHKLKQKMSETHGATSSSNKEVEIGGSNVPPDKKSEKEEAKNDSSDEGGGSLEWERPDDRKGLEYSESEYDHMWFSIKCTSKQELGIVKDIMSVDNPAPLILPPGAQFRDPRKEDNEQKKAGSGEHSNMRVILVSLRNARVRRFLEAEKIEKNQHKVNRTVPQTILQGIPPVPQSQDSKREDRLQRPIPPVRQFQDTKMEDKNQQKADSGEDSGSGNRTDAGEARSQGDDPDSENPEG